MKIDEATSIEKQEVYKNNKKQETEAKPYLFHYLPTECVYNIVNYNLWLLWGCFVAMLWSYNFY